MEACEYNRIDFHKYYEYMNFNENANIYFYIYKDGILQYSDSCSQTVKEKLNVIYEIEDWYGNKLIKARMKHFEI